MLQDHFDPPATLALLERERITYLPCVDTMLLAMAETGRVGDHDLSRLTRIMAAPLNPAGITVAFECFKAEQVWTGYGLTEASAISGIHPARGPGGRGALPPAARASASGWWIRRPASRGRWDAKGRSRSRAGT